MKKGGIYRHKKSDCDYRVIWSGYSGLVSNKLLYDCSVEKEATIQLDGKWYDCKINEDYTLVVLGEYVCILPCDRIVVYQQVNREPIYVRLEEDFQRAFEIR